MSHPVFYISPDLLVVGDVTIDGDEGRHAATVKRIRIGEVIDICDGNGRRAEATVREVGKSHIVATVNAISDEPAPEVTFTAVQALAKGDRAELAIEIATEVGADVILPWKAEHCIAKWDDTGKALIKWQRIAREASKQSRRSRIPVVREARTTAQLIEELKNHDVVYVLHEASTESLANAQIPTHGSIAVVTGPEGGISSSELDQFATAGFSIVRMGDTVMRTSTAGAIAIGVLASKTSRW